MKIIFKYLALAILTITSFSCIKEDGVLVPKGQIKVAVIVPESITEIEDYSIYAKLYREYSGETLELDLEVESISESGALISSYHTLEHGNWQLTNVSLLKKKDVIYVGIDSEDDRANTISPDSYLPMSANVLEGEGTYYEVQLVGFDAAVDVKGTTALYYDFSDGKAYDKVNLNGWTTIDANEEADKSWAYAEQGAEKFAQVSVASGEDATYTSYMISPALDLDNAVNKRVWFKTAKALWTDGTDFKVYLMDSPNILTATKVELENAVLAGKGDVDNEWVVSSEVDLKEYSGVQYVAFYFKGKGGINNSTTFRVDDFVYGDEEIPAEPEYAYLYDFNDGTKDEPINKSEWAVFNIGASSDVEWVYGEYNSNLYAKISAYGSDASDYESWMVSSELDLDAAANKNIKFESKLGYTNGASFKVYLMDNKNPESASVKTELSFTRPEDNSSGYSDFVLSGDIDLSSYAGKVFIGFQYLATTGQTSTFQVDNFYFDFKEGDDDNGGGTDPDPSEPGEDFSYDFMGKAALADIEADFTWADDTKLYLGTEGYGGNFNGLKFGSSKAAGEVSTIGTYSGDVTVTIHGVAWKGMDGIIDITCGDEIKQVNFRPSEFLTGQENTTVSDYDAGTDFATVTFSGVSDATVIKVGAAKRFVVYNLEVKTN